MRSGLVKEATFVGGSLFVIGAALMQFDKKGITDKKYWPYLGVFIVGFSGHLIFEAFGLNKKYCETAFGAESFEADSKEEARLKKYEKTYGKEGAKVRNRIFKRILANAQDGTKAGQWSARKAQSLTEDYEKAMKGKGKKPYKSSKKTKSQKDLKDWGDQDWTTKSGKKSSKTGERYLPKKAIKALSDKEYKETSDKKREDTKKGKQFSKQPKKVADKVKKYRAEGQQERKKMKAKLRIKKPPKRVRDAVGWSEEDETIWIFERDRKLFEKNRYFCKKYDDVPISQRKSFSGNNLRRGNRCINCRSKECPSKLLRYKEKKRVEELERIAQEQKKKREQDWMEKVVKPRKEEMEKKMKKSKEMKLGYDDDDFYYDGLGELFSAEGDIPYGVHVQNHKTTSTVFYKRKPFRKYRGNRHREQARAYAQYMENKLKKNPRHFSYWAEDFEAEGKPTEVEVKRSTNDEKKLMAVFTYPDGKTKTTHFGQRGASDYTKHGEKERMERYLERHGGGTTTSTKEDWQDPTTAGALSRWILWNKPSLSASFNDFKKRFNLKGELKVSKSAESFESDDETQAYLMCDWNKKVPYEIHNAGCKHRNFYENNWESDIMLWNPTSLEGVCRDYIQMWEENLGGTDYVDEADLDAIAKMTFSQFMRSDYTKTTTPIKLSPCHRDNPKIKQFMDNTLVGDISPLKYLDPRKRAESFDAQFTPSQELSDYTPEEIVESSAIEGFQPSKYSVISSSAESKYSYALRTDFWFDDLKKALEMMQDANNNDLIDYELNVDMIGSDGSGSYEMGYGESIDKVISDLMYYYSQERGQVKPFSQLTRGEVNYYPQGQYDGVGAINFNMKRINEEEAVVEVIFPSWSESSLSGDNALFFRTTPSFDAEGGHDGLNLVMMGVPGSGKGTQSKLITKKYGWPQIGMGDLIRDNMRRKTPLGLKCEPYMAKGSLVPDDIMIEMVSQRLKEDDCKNGFILDGFPRTVPQGKALEKITKIDAVIFLDTEKQIVIDRLGGRRTCSDCGEIFHLVFKPPKSEGKCDVCEGELFIRPDDNRKTILNRLKVFNQKTQPLIDFYEERNLLKVVESNSTPEEVFENIDIVIEELLGKETILASESQDTQYCDYHNQIVSGASLNQIMNAEHYTGDRPMTCPICIRTMSSYQTPSADV